VLLPEDKKWEAKLGSWKGQEPFPGLGYQGTEKNSRGYAVQAVKKKRHMITPQGGPPSQRLRYKNAGVKNLMIETSDAMPLSSNGGFYPTEAHRPCGSGQRHESNPGKKRSSELGVGNRSV